VTSIPRSASWSAVCLAALLTAAAVGGCAWTQAVSRALAGGVDITTAAGETLWQHFDQVAFAASQDGTLDVTLAKHSDSNDPKLGRIDQTLWIHQHWRHLPGSTSMDRSSTNCSIRYRVSTAAGWREYRGAGAVFTADGFGGTLRVDLRHATVRSSAAEGELADIYGAATLAGRTTARPDPEAVAAAIALFSPPAAAPAP
jgi:hypothetical protein